MDWEEQTFNDSIRATSCRTAINLVASPPAIAGSIGCHLKQRRTLFKVVFLSYWLDEVHPLLPLSCLVSRASVEHRLYLKVVPGTSLQEAPSGSR